MAAGLPSWDACVGPEGDFFLTTLLRFPASGPTYSFLFISQEQRPVPLSPGPQHPLLLCCVACATLLGDEGWVAPSFTSSPTLTGVSPLPHDWQRQAGGGRPNGRQPALGLTRTRWRRHAEGLAEKSLTGGTGLSPPGSSAQSDGQTSGLIRPPPCMLLHHSLAPSTLGRR